MIATVFIDHQIEIIANELIRILLYFFSDKIQFCWCLGTYFPLIPYVKWLIPLKWSYAFNWIELNVSICYAVAKYVSNQFLRYLIISRQFMCGTLSKFNSLIAWNKLKFVISTCVGELMILINGHAFVESYLIENIAKSIPHM